MALSASDPETVIRALPIWNGGIDIQPLLGGITNKNYLVTDGERRAVVRFGGDIPVHGVMRFNELAATRAAGEAGISPKVLYAAPSVLVLDYITGRSYGPDDARADRDRCVALVKRVHREIARHLRGPTLAFNVFHIIRDYAHTLVEDQSRMTARLPLFLAAAEALERAVGPIDLVFAHNDLLAANFIDDGQRLWLVDWDYAGWNTPLFDLGGLASNNGFDAGDNDAMLSSLFRGAGHRRIAPKISRHALRLAAARGDVEHGVGAQVDDRFRLCRLYGRKSAALRRRLDGISAKWSRA